MSWIDAFVVTIFCPVHAKKVMVARKGTKDETHARRSTMSYEIRVTIEISVSQTGLNASLYRTTQAVQLPQGLLMKYN